MSAIDDTIMRGQRAAIIGQLLSTLSDDAARAQLIRRLHDAAIISEVTADMLTEFYVKAVV